MNVGEPDQVPTFAVSVCPTTAVPLMVGGDWTTGAVGVELMGVSST